MSPTINAMLAFSLACSSSFLTLGQQTPRHTLPGHGGGAVEVVQELVSRLLVLAMHHLAVMRVKVVQVLAMIMKGVLVVRMLGQ